MFNKILIANRGEIACRIIRTAHSMEIKTVAVYSEADRDSKHVVDADESVCIGNAPASESYLIIERIIEACKVSGAEAVHPGYGFLSENTAFAEALQQVGIVFIGPGAHAIETMGDKITSKRLAGDSGVNTIPGHPDVVRSAEEAVKIANDIGYPVMLKASAGGGGKGMRVAYGGQECKDGFERATNEAISSFADGRILIEKFIEQPRHIEIQIIADGHGNIVALNERECSIQRRHQKVVEEAPSSFLDAETRKAMGEQAIALAKAVDYQSAGTVEFIVDAHRKFYFLEMNTRLQVEHPVTELITGLDLVQLMIQVAYGEKLPFTQNDIAINGWAMESRIYAESPFRNFLPSIGRLQNYEPPEQSDNIRVDDGVVAGSEISIYYDPMIAKLVSWGENREQAIEYMQQGLSRYYIRGVDTNLPFVSAIMHHPRFKSGDISTNFIAEEYPDGFSPQQLNDDQLTTLVCVMTSIHYRITQRAATISHQVPGYGRNVSHDWAIVLGQSSYRSTIHGDDEKWIVKFENRDYEIEDAWLLTDSVYVGKMNGKQVCLQIEKDGYRYAVTILDGTHSVFIMTPQTAELNRFMPIKQEADQNRYLLSPMPGLLVSLTTVVGQKIKAGAELAVIEAMKMENSLHAERDCVIANILVSDGETLEVDQPILEFELDE